MQGNAGQWMISIDSDIISVHAHHRDHPWPRLTHGLKLHANLYVLVGVELSPRELLDQILDLYVLQDKTFEEITAAGYEADLVKGVLSMVGRAEFKRRQAPPVLKVSPRAFGTGRRIPIARIIHEA